LLDCLPESFEVMTLAPLVPLGTHSALGTVSQDKIITAVRACEAAADSTNALALEAAARRRNTGGIVRLAAVQRVVRAQQFTGDGSFAHFSLLGLVTAGRDEGSCLFERRAAAEHLQWAARGLTAAGLTGIQLALTPLSETGERIAAAVTEELSAAPGGIVMERSRQSGRGYSSDLCFRVSAQVDGEQEEFADGGLTDWTKKLTASSKERLMISGLGIDRLANLIDPP
jgi:hypothetical protein